MKKTIPSSARKYLDNIQGMIVVLTVNGNIDYINTYAARLLGYDPEDIMGINWFEHFIPIQDRKSSLESYHHYLAGKEAELNTCCNYVETKDGTLHLIEWSSSYLQNAKGEIEGSFSYGEDITEIYMLKLYLAEQQVASKQEKLRAVLDATERERCHPWND